MARPAFVLHVYHDQALAERLVKQIRIFYPEAPLLIIGDGVEVSRELGQQGTVFNGLRLKHKPSGAWTARYLRKGLDETNADVIVKIDPDTCLWRQFTLPDADWFGTPSNSRKFLRGGAVGISRAAAERVLHSGLLMGPSPHCYARFDTFKWPHEECDLAPLSCQDQIMGDVMQALGIGWTNWPDVYILGNPKREAPRGRYALSHPHPTNFRCAVAGTG